jgi:hypothetical protein
MATYSEDMTAPRERLMNDMRRPHGRVMNRRYRRPVNGGADSPMVKRRASHRMVAHRCARPGRVCRGERDQRYKRRRAKRDGGKTKTAVCHGDLLRLRRFAFAAGP